MTTKEIALITGVSRETGLGFETAKQLAEKGYHVIITARNAQKIAVMAEQLRRMYEDITPMILDVTNEESMQQAAAEIAENFGRLDVLINNAALFYGEPNAIEQLDMERVRSEFDTNVFGVWNVTKHMLPLLKKSTHGRVVNVSSGMGAYGDDTFGLLKAPNGHVLVYSLTKLALNGLTLKLATELKKDNIQVNAVCPDFTATYPEYAAMGARPLEQGGASIVAAATLPANGPTGCFFRDGKMIPW